MAETDSARARIESILDEIEQEAQQEDEVVASIEVARLNRDELGSRLVPLAGAYLDAPPWVRLRRPVHCINSVLHTCGTILAWYFQRFPACVRSDVHARWHARL